MDDAGASAELLALSLYSLLTLAITHAARTIVAARLAHRRAGWLDTIVALTTEARASRHRAAGTGRREC